MKTLIESSPNVPVTGDIDDLLKSEIKDEKHRNMTTAPSLTQTKIEDLNPFVHELPLHTTYDRFKLVFMSIFVLPFRVFMIIICLIVAYIFSMAGMFRITREELAARPLSGWRRMAKDQVCQWVRFLYVAYGFHYVQVKGRQARSREAPILAVGPHSSMFDALPVVAMGAPSIVAKGEVQEVPFFARYIDFTQPVYVWREDTNSRQNTIKEIQRRVNSEYEWPQIMIFPEGTCTNRSCLITYKPGAFYPGVPVQPVVLRYPNKTDCITWTWDGPGAIKMLWVTLCQFHNYCEIEYLPVYNPSPEEIDDPWLYARNVRQVMADALKVPVMDYTYDDCRIMQKAKLQNLPCKTGLIEFQKLRTKFRDLTLKDVEGRLMDDYASMALTNGEASLHDLCNYLRIPMTEATVVELFNHYDKDGRGSISFRDFVVFRSEFVSEATSQKTVSWAFELFDKKKDGRIHLQSFAKSLEMALNLGEDISAALFKEMDAGSKGYLTCDDYTAYAERKPDYGQLFLSFQRSVKEGRRTETPSTVKDLASCDKKKTE